LQKGEKKEIPNENEVFEKTEKVDFTIKKYAVQK